MIGGVGRSRRRGRAPPVLPSSAAARRAEHSVSCWYCDCKIYSFNDIIFNLGWRYASGRSFSTWLQNLLVTTICPFIFQLLTSTIQHALNLLQASSFGISIMDIAAIIASTVFSIAFHEFGHAVAAARSLFADLHFLRDVLHLCGVCVIMALLLPVVLYPLFVTGGLMITGVPEASPLSGYLSAHNFILSVDGLNITRADEWMKMLTQDNVVQISSRDLLEGSEGYRATGSRKGYCVPNSWMDASKNLWQINDKLSCPDDLVAFQRMSEKGIGKKEVEDKYCLIAKDVVKLKKCGNGWRGAEDGRSNFACLEDEYCLVPVLGPGISWIEISYARPYSLECLQKERNSSLLHDGNNNPGLGPCQGTFVYAGDLLSAAHSIKLSSYRPRWPLLLFIADVPRILQDGLSCLFRVSAALAVVNCLPVYFLDGEAILETMLSYFSWFTRRQQRNILKVCRFLWTILSIVLFSRTLYSMTLYYGFV
uniref:Endopeptidase S2P n=1 Tax=Oryza rufipogon TaxID=4529 RepID=A0A0E0N046_ORYRU